MGEPYNDLEDLIKRLEKMRDTGKRDIGLVSPKTIYLLALEIQKIKEKLE